MNATDADLPVSPEATPAATPAASEPAAAQPSDKPRRRRSAVSASSGEGSGTTDAAASVSAADPGASAAGALPEMTGGEQHGAAPEVTEQGGPEGDHVGGGRRGRRRGRRGADRRREGGEQAGEAAAGQDGGGDAATEAAPAALAPREAGEVFEQVVSGAYDAEPAVEDDPANEEPRRILAADADAPKLQKVLAQAGVASRRDLEQMIAEGRVTVNDEVAHTGQRVSFGDRISVDGKPVRYRIAPPPPRVLAYHKPVGEVVTHEDPQQRPTVFRRLPRLAQGKWQSVGRLDINTEGLLLFTNSGELANQLMHPRFGVEREYAVRSLGVLSDEARARLLEGVEIDGQRAAFKSIENGGGEGANHWYRVVINEGRNREVRRLFEAVGHAVSRLIRIRYGSVVLPKGLRRGVWVDLGEHDTRALRRMASGPQAVREGAARGPAGEGERASGQGAQPRAERGPRPARAARNERPERPERPDRGERSQRNARREPGEGGAIPNPLQQTFDKRAFQQDRRKVRDIPEDGPIPNPLQQTYDKRALQNERRPQREYAEDGPIPNPLQQTYDKRLGQGSQGTGGFGFIGADAFHRKSGGRGGRSGGGGGSGGGGSGGGGRRGGGQGRSGGRGGQGR